MKTLTVHLPEEANENEVKMAVAALLFNKRLSTSARLQVMRGPLKENFWKQQENLESPSSITLPAI